MDRFDEIYGRVHRFYTSEASVETDLKKSRDALMGYQRIVSFLKQYLTIDLMKTGKNGPLEYINSDMADRLPYPSNLTTRNMILIQGWDFMDDPLSMVQVALCIGPSMQGLRLTGLYTKDGIRHMPTIFLYVTPDKIDYSMGQVFRRQLAEFVSSNRKLQKTFVHEFKHYTDGVEALLKNISSNPLKGYKIFKPMPEDAAQRTIDKRNPNITYDFGTYVRNTSEVNARYAEWLVDILYAFDNLAEVKARGILGAFPTFQMFWDYMWAHYAPDEFLEYSTPKLEKYLKKRLYKFYDYTRDLTLPPKTKSEAQAIAQQYIEKEQQ